MANHLDSAWTRNPQLHETAVSLVNAGLLGRELEDAIESAVGERVSKNAIHKHLRSCSGSCGSFAIRESRTPVPQFSAPDIQQMVREAVREILAEQAKPDVPDQSAFDDGATVLISDAHIPLHDMRKFDAVIQFCETQPKGYLKRLVLAGDIFDGTNLSRYPKGSREEGHGGDLGDEMAMGRGQINALVRTIEGECWLQSGNHELGRLHKHMAQERGIPAEPLEMEHLLKFYEYDERLVFYPNRKLTIGRGEQGMVDIIHGERYNKHTAATVLADNLYRSVIQGHTHRPQVHWVRGRFGYVNGHLHDLGKVGYMPDPQWQSGFTILEHWNNGRQAVPYFVPIADDGSFSFHGKTYRG